MGELGKVSAILNQDRLQQNSNGRMAKSKSTRIFPVKRSQSALGGNVVAPIKSPKSLKGLKLGEQGFDHMTLEPIHAYKRRMTRDLQKEDVECLTGEKKEVESVKNVAVDVAVDEEKSEGAPLDMHLGLESHEGSDEEHDEQADQDMMPPSAATMSKVRKQQTLTALFASINGGTPV